MINQISAPNGLGNVSKPQSFDLNNTDFADILNKQLNASETQLSSNLVGEMGMPAGLQIEPMEGMGIDFDLDMGLERTKDKQNRIEEPFVMKDIDMGDYFSNLLKTNTEGGKEFMNFARKQAANIYDTFGKSYVSDLKEFAQDIQGMI